ncbi:unnamed protein product [Brassica rapa subsp. narinosa]
MVLDKVCEFSWYGLVIWNNAGTRVINACMKNIHRLSW